MLLHIKWVSSPSSGLISREALGANNCHTSAYSASVDCYLAIYPAMVFRKMGFSIIKKIGLSLVLGLGIGATAVACLKISYLHVLSNEDFTCVCLTCQMPQLGLQPKSANFDVTRDDTAAHNLDDVR